MTTDTQDLSSVRESFDRLVRIFADDAKSRAELEAMFEPLLSGKMTFEEHREFLKKQYGQ